MINKITAVIVLLIIHILVPSLVAQRFSPVCLDHAKSVRRPHAIGLYNKNANKTFLCWAYENMDIAVIEYDHSLGRWSEKKILVGIGKKDFHNYPVMVQDKDGYLHVFASHMGSGKYVYYKSRFSNSIDGWKSERIKPLDDGGIGVSYITPMVYEKTGEIFIFCRALYPKEDFYDSQRKYIMLRLNPLKSLWSEPQVIISFSNTIHLNNSPYLANIVFAPRQNMYPDRFLLTWTTCNGHPKNVPVKYNNVYFSYMSLENVDNHKTHNLYSVDKKILGKTISEKSRDQVLLFDTGNVSYRSIHYSVLTSYADNGSPLIIFRYKKKKEDSTVQVNLWSAVYKDGKWKNKKVNDNQYFFINEFQKIQGGQRMIAFDFEKINKFYISTNNCEDWGVEKDFSDYKKLKKWGAITNSNSEMEYFVSVIGKSYDLTHSQPCYIYGNLSPQLLCHYTFDNETNQIVGDTGLYQINGKMKYSKRGKGKIGNAFYSTKLKPNSVFFPHRTEIVDDFTVDFWIKILPSCDPKNKMMLVGISKDKSDSELQTGWKVGSFIHGKDILQFAVCDINGLRQEVGVLDFFKKHQGVWTKVTVVFKKNKFMKILINEVCEVTEKTSLVNVAYSSDGFLSIGSEHFYGMLDEIKICDGVIYKPEILKSYQYRKSILN